MQYRIRHAHVWFGWGQMQWCGPLLRESWCVLGIILDQVQVLVVRGRNSCILCPIKNGKSRRMGEEVQMETRHVLQYLSKSDHIATMLLPHSFNFVQQHTVFRASYQRIRCPWRKEWDYSFIRHRIEIIRDQFSDSIVQHFTLFIEYHVVCKTVIFFKWQIRGILFLDFTDVLWQLQPSFLSREFWAMLNDVRQLQKPKRTDIRTFLGAIYIWVYESWVYWSCKSKGHALAHTIFGRPRLGARHGESDK